MPAAMSTRSSEVTCLGRLDNISVVLSTTTWTVSLSTGCMGVDSSRQRDPASPQMTRETYASALPLANLKTQLNSRKLARQAPTTIWQFWEQHSPLSCFFQGIELRDSL